MHQLSKQHKYARYRLKLPAKNLLRDRPNQKDSLYYIPESAIARKLRQSIIYFASQNNKDFKDTTNTKGNDLTIDISSADAETKSFVDMVTTRMCARIISSFRCLYTKYIDSQNAVLMINISSQNRKMLMELLDCDYYQKCKSSLSTRKRGSFDASAVAMNDFWPFKKDVNASSKGKYSLINEQMGKYTQETTESEKGLSDTELIQWTLSKLILAMEPSVLEISNLMNDSFLRFKIKHQEVIDQLVGSSLRSRNSI